jgi:hypothetical protein
VPVEDRFDSRSLHLAPLEAQGCAIEHQQLVLGPAKPALHAVKPTLDPVEPLADLAMNPVELLVEPGR